MLKLQNRSTMQQEYKAVFLYLDSIEPQGLGESVSGFGDLVHPTRMTLVKCMMQFVY